MSKLKLRRRPYGEKQIFKVPCIHCGKPSFYQWQLNCCAAPDLRGTYFGVCPDCDIILNKHTLEFRKADEANILLEEYTRKVRSAVRHAVKNYGYKEDWDEVTSNTKQINSKRKRR
jgi:hypothetical protein